MRQLIILLSLSFGAALGAVLPATAQMSIGIGIGAPNLNIGINYPVYPRFEQVPGYPVYYAPQVDSNYFFYDGLYWVYANDSWYASSWYNGPWALVSPMVVPVYVLRVPVRYYREPPVYFRGWRQDAPPRWDEHWGEDWRRQRNGWDHWNRTSVPPPAPLPIYQQRYSGGRYPSYEQQRTIMNQNYHYQPREAVVQQHYQRYLAPTAAVAQQSPPRSQHSQQSAQNRNSAPQNESGSRPQPHQAAPPPPQPVPQRKPPPPPSVQDQTSTGPGESSSKQPPQHQPQQQQPIGQHNAAPGQPESGGRERQEPHQQQPPGEDHGPPGQGANVPRESKPEQGREESGGDVRDKETPHDNR